MKNEKLLNALEEVDEKFITASSPENTKKTKKVKMNAWVKWGAVAACLCLVAGIGVMNIDRGLSGGISEQGGGAPQHGGTVPEGCQYGTAGYYETTMKDGTRYHMLGITYDRGQSSVPVPKTENEESATEASEIAGDTAFLWMVRGHRLDTDLSIYQPEEVTVSLIEQQEGRLFYIDYDGIYVGVEQTSVSAEELFAVIETIE